MNRRTLVSAFVAATVTAATVAAVLLSPAASAASDTSAPTVPGSPAAATVTNASVTLVWARSTDDVGVTGYEIFRSPSSPTAFTPVGTSSSATFTDTGLSPGTVYLYRVRASDAAGNLSAFSPAAPAMTSGPCASPPPAPGNLRLLSSAPNVVNLRWGIVVPTAGCSPAGFNVMRALGASGGAFTLVAQIGFTDSFADATVTPGTTYRYQVRARSANGLVSGPSNTLQVTTPTACTPPLPMGSLRVSGVGASSVSLSWAGPTNPACFVYDILRAPGATGTTFTVVGTTGGLSFTDTGLSLNTTYRYLVQGRILPTNAVWGTTGPVAAATSQGCLLIPPPAPGNLTAANVTAVSVSLTWAVTAAPGCLLTYEILRAPGASGGTFTPVGTTPGNGFTDTGLTPGTTYRYQGRTRDQAGNLSAPSNTVTVTTSPGTGGCSATYRVANAWGGAFQGEVVVTNSGTSPIAGWRVTVTLSSGVSITQLWGGRTDQTTSPFAVTNETWNGALAANATASFGFNANANGSTGATGTVICTAE
jgi:chitodextrinase